MAAPDIWSALRQKDNKALKELIANGADVNTSGAVSASDSSLIARPPRNNAMTRSSPNMHT